MNSDGGAITIAAIAGDSAETVTINANDVAGTGVTTETVRLGDVGDSGHAQIHNVTVTGDGGITLTGAIYTASAGDGTGADVVFNDAVTLMVMSLLILMTVQMMDSLHLQPQLMHKPQVLLRQVRL